MEKNTEARMRESRGREPKDPRETIITRAPKMTKMMVEGKLTKGSRIESPLTIESRSPSFKSQESVSIGYVSSSEEASQFTSKSKSSSLESSLF